MYTSRQLSIRHPGTLMQEGRTTKITHTNTGALRWAQGRPHRAGFRSLRAAREAGVKASRLQRSAGVGCVAGPRGHCLQRHREGGERRWSRRGRGSEARLPGRDRGRPEAVHNCSPAPRQACPGRKDAGPLETRGSSQLLDPSLAWQGTPSSALCVWPAEMPLPRSRLVEARTADFGTHICL